MTTGGIPDTSNAASRTEDNKTIWYGTDWTYEIIDKSHSTLTLKSESYNFNNTKPTTEDGETLKLVKCKVVVESGATITGGRFHQMLNYGTVENSLLVSDGIINRGGTMTNCLFRRTSLPEGVANYHKLTEVNNSKFEATLLNAPYTFSDWGIYYFTGTPTLRVKLSSNKEITCINGEKLYGNLSGPDTYGYYTFTPKAGEDVVLNQEPYVTDLVMTTGGFLDTTGREPIYDSAKNVIGCKGKGWKYENGTLTLESGEYDFTYTEPRNTASSRYGDSVKCNIVVNKGAAITGGILGGDSLTNSGTVKDILFMGYWLKNNNGTLSCLLGPSVYDHPSFTRHTVKAVDGSEIYYTVNQQSTGNGKQLYFTGTPKFTVMLEDSTIHHINGRTDYGGLKKESNSDYYTFTPEKEEDIVLNDSIIHEPFTMTNGYPTASNGGKTACKGEGWEYILGDPEHGDFLFLSNAQIDFSKISDGSPVECKLFIGHGVAVQGGTFNGDVINNGGGILGGTFNGAVENRGTIENGVFNGAVENHGTIENGVFNGAVTNIDPGTVSDSITGTGTLNGKPITPNAYTLTVTGGGLVNGKTSAVVEAGDEVCLTVGEMQDGMSFNYWDLPTALIKALTDKDSTFSNKVEPLTFTMPDLSGYTEDTRFTIRLDIRPAELPDDDDGPSVLGTMATVAVGGAAAGILVWQGVSLGVDSYLQLSLPGGVPVPANRIELVKLLWETAGKPDVVLPALYGDVSAEDGELQKATRWAIDNGLVKPADETDASRFDPDRSVSKYEVARAWFKVQQMLK